MMSHMANIRSVLEHGSPKHRQMTLEHLTAGLLEYATNEQGAKSVNKAMKEGGKDTLDRFVKRMAEPVKGYVVAYCGSICPRVRLTRTIVVAVR